MILTHSLTCKVAQDPSKESDHETTFTRYEVMSDQKEFTLIELQLIVKFKNETVIRVKDYKVARSFTSLQEWNQ